MKLFVIKDTSEEFYFQVDKTNQSFMFIDKLAHELSNENFCFEGKWQEGLPENDSYQGYEKEGLYMGVVISDKRIHVIIKGISIKDKEKIKRKIKENFELVKQKTNYKTV